MPAPSHMRVFAKLPKPSPKRDPDVRRQVDAEREREGDLASQARSEAAQAHAQRKGLDKEARALAAKQARPY